MNGSQITALKPNVVTLPITQPATFIEAANRFLREEMQQIRCVGRQHLLACTRTLNRFAAVCPPWVHEIQYHHARHFLATLNAQFAPAMVKNGYAEARSFLSWAEREGHHPGPNPFIGHRLPQRDRNSADRLRIIPPEEIDAMFVKPEHIRQRAMTIALWGTALRISELGRVYRTDVHVQQLRLHVRNKRIGSDGRDERTKTRRARDVPISSPEILESLMYCAELVAQRRMVERTSFAHHIHNESLRIGVEAIHPHALRHSRISAWVAANVDLGDVQRWAGHASLEMTSRYAGARRFLTQPAPADGLKKSRRPKQANERAPGAEGAK